MSRNLGTPHYRGLIARTFGGATPHYACCHWERGLGCGKSGNQPCRIHQVLRDSKLQVASLGSAVGPAELDQWQRQITAFFTAGSGRCVHSGKRAKREQFNVPRLASYDWLVAVDNSLRQATCKGLERFAGADQHMANDKVPPTLVLAIDQCQLQWTAMHFLQHGPP